jgi:hypothetical protein
MNSSFAKTLQEIPQIRQALDQYTEQQKAQYLKENPKMAQILQLFEDKPYMEDMATAFAAGKGQEVMNIMQKNDPQMYAQMVQSGTDKGLEQMFTTPEGRQQVTEKFKSLAPEVQQQVIESVLTPEMKQKYMQQNIGGMIQKYLPWLAIGGGLLGMLGGGRGMFGGGGGYPMMGGSPMSMYQAGLQANMPAWR